MLKRRACIALGLGTLLAGAFAFVPTDARARDVEVPVRVQAELFAKLAGYDRNFAARAVTKATVLVFVKKGDADSERVGAQLVHELDAVPTMAGLPHVQEVVAFSTPARAAAACRERRAAMIYVAPGLSDQVAAIAAALEGVDVLSAAALGDDVDHGVVVGVELASGKPRLIVNLGRARRQNVSFKPEVLPLARVIQ